MKTTAPGWLRSSRFLIGVASALAAIAAALLLATMGDAPMGVCGPPCLGRRLEATLDAAGQVPGAHRAAAADIVDRELAWSAFDASAWLRRAALQTAQAGRLNAEAQKALEMSYRVAPVDVSVARWRLTFLFQNWEGASALSRRQARLEILSLAAAPQNRPALKAIEQTISNPAGHLAYRLITDEFSPG